MNFDMVKKLVAYCREQEKIHNKNFRFTMTTNGCLLYTSHLQEAAQSPVPLCIAEHAARGDHAVGLNENKEVTMANVKLGTKAVGLSLIHI